MSTPLTGRYSPPPALTDGTWEWPSDLAYYVREHHVRLPAEFLQHMVSRRWEIPALSEEQVMELLTDG